MKFKILFTIFAALSSGIALCVAFIMPIWIMFTTTEVPAEYLVYLFISDMHVACGLYCFGYFLDVMSKEKVYVKTRNPKPSDEEKLIFTLMIIFFITSIFNVLLS